MFTYVFLLNILESFMSKKVCSGVVGSSLVRCV